MTDKISGNLRALLATFLLAIAMTVSSPAVHAQSARGSYVTTADVPLRSGPGNFHEVITTLPKGIKINVAGKEGFWLKVESKHGGKPGYIDEQFATPTTAAAAPPAQKTSPTASVVGEYRTLRELELRDGPGTKYPTVAKLPTGIKINVVRAEGDWLRVESKKGGKPGYVDRRDVERWTNR